MQSWSTFEQRKKEEGHDNGSNVVAAHHTNTNLHALSVSCSSSNIAPTSATLLRHSGLSAPSSNSSSKEHESSNGNGGADDEFRLRFHWMRPHPSLAFALEGGEMAIKDNDAVEQKMDNANEAAAAAVEASKLMDAYRSSQIRKLNLTDNNDDGNKNDKISDIDDSNNNAPNNPNLPFKLPNLRINLARLVEPPLMSNWLPGEDIDYYEEVDGDGKK